EIRTRRLLDQLYAFGATPETATELSAQSGAPAIAQASARLVAAKFLRDDNARLLRMERAQIELSLTGWLASRVYPDVFPAIESCRAERPEQLEACATGEMRKLASEHFSEQFRHNVHSVMNSAGQRVEFRVRAIQRFDVRFPAGNIARPEIRPRVYLFQENIMQAEDARTIWELQTPEALDARLVSRYEAVNWPAFETGTAEVKLAISLPKTPVTDAGSAESYVIRSRARRQTRRIEIEAASARAAFYALAQLEQMGAAGKLRDDFQLSEAPAMRDRGVFDGQDASGRSLKDRLDTMRAMGRMRLNRYFYCPPTAESTSTAQLAIQMGAQLKDLARTADENFIELFYVFAAAGTDDADVQRIGQQAAGLTGLGIRHFALMASPGRTDAGAQVAARLAQYLETNVPDVDVSVTALPGAPDAQALPSALTNLPLLNPAFASGPADAAKSPAGKHFMSFEAPALIAILPPHSRLFTVPLAMLGDYAWSPQKYDETTALTSALSRFYTPDTRAGLRVWINAFRKPESLAAGTDEARKWMADLRASLESMHTTREQGLLRGELAVILAGVATGHPQNRLSVFPAPVRQDNAVHPEN
ncbi:MAG: beta-N-acetylglucosaminidase domain-containing protein, partial [Blastocatellia bacterium]